MNFYFCWERNFAGEWHAVVYHGEAPKPEKVSDGDRPTRTTPVLVDPQFISGDSPIFGALIKAYPAPVEAA